MVHVSDGPQHRHASNRASSRRNKPWRAFVAVVVLLSLVGLQTIQLEPLRVAGGAVWFKHGFHYLSNADITNRTERLEAPQEQVMSTKVSTATSPCDSVGSGYCQQSPGVYAYKTLVKAAVPYKPGTPDTKQVIGYCTLCNDGSFSPSCAVGRGACSYHRGVASYNVERYRIIPGTPAIQAQSAIYTYAAATYKDSPLYSQPTASALTKVVGY